MRPIPQSRHLVAILLLAGVAATSGYLAAHDERLSDAQEYAATAALKRNAADRFAHDPIYGPSRLWQFHPPAFQIPLEMVLIPTGYRDPMLPFRIMTGVVVMVYLCGMYALLYRQTRSWSISVFVAVLSSTVTYAIGGAFWGVGSLGSIEPAGLCIAVIPLVLLAYRRHGRTWRVLLVFGFIGLLGNLHPATAMNLSLVLLIAFLAERRFSLRAWPTAIGSGICAFVGALPYLWYCYWLRRELTPPDAVVSTQTIYEAIAIGEWNVLYPEILRSVLSWPLFLFLLVVPLTVVLNRLERFPIRNFRFWLWFIGAGLFVTFVLQGASQLIGTLRPAGPPILTFVWASSLVMLPLYALLAQVLTSLFRITRTHRALVRWGCAAFAAAWIIPSSNFRVARYATLEAANTFVHLFAERPAEPPGIRSPADRPWRKVQEHRDKLRRAAELVEIGQWAQDPRNTGIDAVFLCNRVEFRMLSRRSIVAAGDDLPFFYHFAPWRLQEWAKAVVLQSRIFFALQGAEPVALPELIRELSSQKQFDGVKEWYIILPGRATHGKLEDLELKWSGEFHQVYRFRR